jgi:DNA-binding LacI/PurR family transcriptional regulator
VSPDAVERVLRAAKQIGYDPTQIRRGRKPKSADGIRTHNIALLHLRANTTLSLSVLRAVEQLLSARNLNLIVGHVSAADDLPQAVRSGNVDGILGYGQFPASAVTAGVKRIPAVWMMTRNDFEPDLWGDRVQPDHKSIGRLAARYLLEHEHQHLAFVGAGSHMAAPAVADRWGAFYAVANTRAQSVRMITTSVGTVFSPEFQENVYAAARQIAELNPRPTGLFVAADRITRVLHRALEQFGVRVGQDVDIVSCDNEPEILAELRPSPPSIDLNRDEIARQAVERLLWRMRNGVESPQVVTSVRPALAGFAEPGAESVVIGIDDDTDDLDSNGNGFNADGDSNGHSDKG